MRSFLREPLIHFLLLGGMIYVFHALVVSNESDTLGKDQILVNRQSLITYMQYRAKMFEPGLFDKSYNSMDASQKQKLANEYLQEEILYREARALGLMEADYIIRQRLVQKQQYLIDDLLVSDPGDDALRDYLKRNMERYIVASSVTFTHIFFSEKVKGEEGAAKAAKLLKHQLDKQPVSFNDAASYSEIFPYFLNYIERTEDYVAGHFGKKAAQAIFGLEASPEKWLGPIRSSYGVHLILLTRKTPSRAANLQEIRSRVLDDWRDDERRRLRSQVIGELKKKYDITYDFESP